MTKLKTLKTIHITFCSIFILSYIIGGNFSIENISSLTVDINLFISVGVTIYSIFFGLFLFKINKKKFEKNKTTSRSDFEFTNHLIRYSFLMGGGLLILILTPNNLIFGLIILIYLIFLTPKESKHKDLFKD